jgi:periplasmic protein TonB
MSSGGQHRSDLVATRDHVADLWNAVLHPPEQSAPIVALSNVVPFPQVRRETGAAEPAIALDPVERPAPDVTAREGRARFLAFIAVSLLVHGGLYAVFNREPEPMASIGLEAISVEIVLGANTLAGLAVTPGENEVQNTPADDPDPQPTDSETATAKPEQAPEAKPVQDAAPPETAVVESKPEQPVIAAAETPPQPQQIAALPAEDAPREPEWAVAPEEPTPPVKPQPAAPQAKPEPQPKPVQKREPKPERAAKPKQPGPRARTASTEPAGTGPRASAASGVGPGQSHSDSNYRGLVAAHLARHKRYPADARSRGDQGTAVVSFAFDGGGRVTRVSLARGTGIASLDQEVQAMVHRASPFPAPPGGRGMSFTAPVTFRIQ